MVLELKTYKPGTRHALFVFFRPESVWVQWFKEVILKGSVHNYWTTPTRQSYSWLVNKLLKLKSVVFPLIKLRLQNGETTRFWSDNWTPFGDLRTYLSATNSRMGISLDATVSSLLVDGTWSLPPARSEAQVELYSYLTTIQLAPTQDYYEWEINGQVYTSYKTGQLYDYLCEPRPDVFWHKAVWISRAIPLHNFHAWLVVQNRIPTRDRLISWGLQVPSLCLLCNQTDESRDHLYWDCGYAFDLWNRVAGRCGIIPQRNWDNSLNQMLSLSPAASSMRSLTLLGWQASIYWIWNERNNRLHANQFRSLNSLFYIIDHQIRNKIQSFRDTNPRRSSQMMQRWFG